MALGSTLKISFDSTAVQRGLAGLKTNLGNLSNAGVGITKVGTAITALGIAGAAATAALALKLNSIGESALIADNRLKNITKQMGLFGNKSDDVAERLLDFADAQERAVGADGIVETQAKLMTFKELAASADTMGGAFDRATIAAVDMAAAGFGQAEQNAVQLGKALNDPIKGINSLTKSGITFTAEEKKKIATLVQSNQMLKAQDLVLKAIENQVGGTAAATATASGKIKASLTQVVEAFAIPFSQGFSSLPGSLESVFPALIEKASTIGGIVSGAISDSLAGNQDKFVALGKLIGDVIGAAATAAFQSWSSTWVESAGNLKLVPAGKTINELSGGALQGQSFADLFDAQMVNRGIRQQGENLARGTVGLVEGTNGEWRHAAPGQATPYRDQYGNAVVQELKAIRQNTEGGSKM